MSQVDGSPALGILHVANKVTRSGNGIINVMVDLAIEQRRAGHSVTVAAGRGEYIELLRAHGVEYVHLPQHGFRNALTAIPRLWTLLWRSPVDIIHAHMVSGALIARLVTLGRRTRVVTHVHNSWQRHASLMRVGHHVVAVSQAVRDEMVSRGIPASRISTVLNGTIGSMRAAPPGTLQQPVALESPAILSVAGMYVRKGIADLIEAVAALRQRIPQVRLYLAGDGPDRANFERVVRDRDLTGTVIFLGFRQDVDALMRQADVLVLASHAEPCSLVLSEARALGLPIVATAVGGTVEVLEGGLGGVLVPPRDPPALAAALAQVLQDHEFRQELRRRAASNLDSWRVERVAREMVHVYRALLRR
jgi:glycosyltransferase involved in cell wall biosynthesis